MVTVDHTQSGVAYQLRQDEVNTPVNPPGHHYGDRGVQRVRVQVDLGVETVGEEQLWLPTGEIETETTFNVLATKILTGVSAPLSGKATIEVQ